MDESAEVVDGLESRLIGALQPIRGFFLAQVLHTFMNSGVYDRVRTSRPVAVGRLADTCGLDAERLRGLLRYLANENVVELTVEDTVSLTARGLDLAEFRPWYTLLVGGYAKTFLELGDMLADGSRFAGRDSLQVGLGSCGISEYDALPMCRRLLGRLPACTGTIVDVGCGDGRYLVELCASVPDVRGIGVDPHEPTIAAARELVDACGLAGQVEIIQGDLVSLPDLDSVARPICFIAAFVLQEALAQTGRASVVKALRESAERYLGAHWIVVEVDHRPSDPAVMGHPLGLAYYNPYYLIHQITEQRLETKAFWESVFAEAGMRVIAVETPDPTYDSLALKVGYLIGPAEVAH